MLEIIHKQGQKAPCSISQDPWTWYMGPCMHPYTNLDLLGIGQNVFTTARFNICIDATEKKFESLDTRARNPKHLENEPCFTPVKNFLILTLHTPRESLYWSLISFLTSRLNHETSSGPSKKIHNILIYNKTINCKNSQKVPFGR